MSEEVLFKNQYGCIKQCIINNEIPVIQFEHITGKGAVSLYGGQVLSWQPTDNRDVFWKSNRSFYDAEHAIRGGIPICWPWFGAEVLQSDGRIIKTSNHGFARDNLWQLEVFHLDESAVTIILTFSGESYSTFWPHKFQLTQTLIFSPMFEQTLTIKNLSDSEISYTGALHSYFSVSEARKIDISHLSSVFYDDKLSGEKGKLDNLSDYYGPVDRIYHSNKKMTIYDPHWQRKIIVTSENCQQWVLWNPGDTAEQMKDMHSDAAKEFICLEAANTQWQSIASQESLSIKQSVNIQKY